MAPLLWLCVAALLGPNAGLPAPFSLVLLHTNDMHSRFEQTDAGSNKCPQDGRCYGGFARVAHEVRTARAKAAAGESPPVLFLVAGDTFQGTIWYTVHKWRIAAKFTNLLQPDAMSLGNHEFDDGVAGLAPFLNSVTCPVLAANVDTSLEPTITVNKSVVLNVRGVQVGVVGYLTPDTKNISQTERVEISDEVEALTREMQRLKDAGVDILIALGHSGYDIDLRIAREVPHVDVVIGGHTNTFLYDGNQPDSDVPDGLYPTVVTQPSGRKVPVVQAYAYTKYLGHLTMEFDKNGEAHVYYGNPILLDNTVPQDQDILDELEIWRKDVSKFSKEKVGSTKVYLEGNSKQCRVVECNLGNLITDAMVFYHLRSYRGPGWTDAPIAIQHGGGIRSSIDSPNGEVTMEDLMAVLPFDNRMHVMILNGSQVLEMLEWSVYRHDPAGIINSGAFLQYSGIEVTYNMSKPPGQRVTSAMLRCGLCRVPQYYPLNITQQYNILVPEYLAKGGDSYSVLKRCNSTKYEYSDLSAVVEYFTLKYPVYPGLEGRIVFNPSLKDIVESSKGSASRLSAALISIISCVIFTLSYV